MQQIHKITGRLSCIPNNIEKYISFSAGQLKFLDSFQFMASSLAKLVDATDKDDFKITRNSHKHGIKCEALDKYIKSREPMLQDLVNCRHITRDEAKKFSLAIMNGKQINLQPSDPPWLIGYYIGMRNIISAVVQLNRRCMNLLSNQNIVIITWKGPRLTTCYASWKTKH